ncbi:hypothetical protein BABINDRAFT_160302 [Babjeviella inositovora NRRL Y-12698]|uniref:Uncharacterized protein n=1 Tax=Babjeviella inositovora NRRL Y-12698 TaxID=984486 RepID=A0A1E3QYC1_9ASCO|nr:uncharacterized protein BABINDRAFT_160302 [Babjeviella inositovora NRRL Y-12698]ODQ82112.1 hypothetical protein BABINDRAFT_160302 [Babjeviella inositovora NRRL Y-12698]
MKQNSPSPSPTPSPPRAWTTAEELKLFEQICQNKPLGANAVRAVMTITRALNDHRHTPSDDETALPEDTIEFTEHDVKAKLHQLYNMTALQELVDEVVEDSEEEPKEPVTRKRTRSSVARVRESGSVLDSSDISDIESVDEEDVKEDKVQPEKVEDDEAGKPRHHPSKSIEGQSDTDKGGSDKPESEMSGNEIEDTDDESKSHTEKSDEESTRSDEGSESDDSNEESGSGEEGDTDRKRRKVVRPASKRQKVASNVSTPKRSTPRPKQTRSAIKSAMKKTVPTTPARKGVSSEVNTPLSSRPSTRRSTRNTPAGSGTPGVEESDMETPAKRITRRSARRK